MDKAQVIYFLFSSKEPHVKVGISNNPNVCGKAVGDPIDFARSYYVTSEKQSARKIERILHAWIDDYKVNKAVACGHTEWFSIECWPEIQSFISDQKDRFGLSELKLIPPEPKPAISTARRKVPLRKRITMAKVERYERPRLTSMRKRALAFGDFIQTSVASGTCCGQIDLCIKHFLFGDYRTNRYFVFKYNQEYKDWRQSFRGVNFQGFCRMRNFYGGSKEIISDKLNLALITIESSYCERDKEEGMFDFIKNIDAVIAAVPAVTDLALIEVLKAYEC